VGPDRLNRRLKCSGKFEFHSYYESLSGSNAVVFPWRSVWSTKAPKKVAFFIWITAWGKILTYNNLMKRGITLVNRCCMCKCSGETVEHFLIHYVIAKGLWLLAFPFGVHWVLPE
jgi:hypothetical protein